MMEVVAFSVSPYASCKRPKRSLDPLLGETYELVHPEKGFRMVSEHVRHSLVSPEPLCQIKRASSHSLSSQHSASNFIARPDALPLSAINL